MLRWRTDWTAEEKRDYVSGKLLDGTTEVARLLGSPLGSMGVSPRVAPAQYKILVVTSQETNSAVTITGTNGFSKMYIIDGRETAPLDDLDYMRVRYFEDFAWKPFFQTVTNRTERPPN